MGRPRRRALWGVLLGCAVGVAASWGCGGRAALTEVSLVRAFEDASFIGTEPVLDLRRGEGEGRLPLAGQSPGFVLGAGWGSRQPWGAWGLGRSSQMAVQILDPSLDTLTLEARPYHQRPGDPQTVAIDVNGAACGVVKLKRGWRRYRFVLPPGLLEAGANTVRLSYAYSDSPRRLGRRDDDRQLAVALRRLALGHGAGRVAAEPAVRALAPAGRVIIGRPGRLLVPVVLPPGSRELALGAVVLQGGPDQGPARLATRLVRLDGREDELFTAERRGPGPLVPASGPVQLPEDTAGVVFLELDARFAVGARLILRQPAILAAPPAAPTPLPTEDEGGTTSSPPDIVVILLDAARPDHFGCYGYPRPTTPEIDRLADESLIFSRAFAESPYTVASVATLLTGLPPTVHGVIHTTQRLPDGVPTLVEKLRAAGYATEGVSASPYDSVACGSARGYEAFEQLWTEHPYPRFADPDLLSGRALELLARGTGGRPLFLLLHYESPHEPYAPAPRFDLFSDPHYRGPADGSPPALARIRHRVAPPSAVDVAQLVGLYDGNLRTADAAVGRVLVALRARPRWRDTVVVVLADHGEAFFEHGEQGHSTTVYSEMLRVPLILRLADAERGRRVDTGRLATLGDVAPTLLALAGVKAEGTIPSVNLLSPPAVGDRVVVARSGGDHPQWAVLTPRWKAIAAGSVRRELYDLRRDPEEREDLAASRPLLLDGLVRLLHRAAEARATEAGERQLGPGELATLRSLGYL